MSIPKRKKLIVIYLYNGMLLSNEHIHIDYIERERNTLDNYVGDSVVADRILDKILKVDISHTKEILK